ncbi:MAG TPA: extracellular solute-binding protein [Candidatus Methylomirabilis sp.]|nr:extracellular solute-binding protein [Candidatus Methylomirabilis sp.]
MGRVRWGAIGVGILLAVCVGGTTGLSAFAADTSLVVYSANDTDLNNFVFGMFQKETGVAVQTVTAGSGVLLKRMAAEKDRPLGDVLWGVSTVILDANKAYFEPYASKNAEAVPPTFRDSDNLWIGTNAHVIIIQVNRKLLGSAPAPRTWRDLQNPQWKGKVVMADPANSGGAFTQVTRMIDLFGGGDREKGWQELEKVVRNLRFLNKISLVYTGVGNGEYPVGLSLEYAAYEYVQGGAPVEIVYPEDGTVVQVEGMGIIKGAQHPEAARKFEDFITRKDVREAILKKFFRRPARTDLDYAALGIKLPALKDIKLASYDFRGWAKDRDAVLKRVQEMILQTR